MQGSMHAVRVLWALSGRVSSRNVLQAGPGGRTTKDETNLTDTGSAGFLFMCSPGDGCTCPSATFGAPPAFGAPRGCPALLKRMATANDASRFLLPLSLPT